MYIQGTMDFLKKPTLIGFLLSTFLIFTLENAEQVYGQEEELSHSR